MFLDAHEALATLRLEGDCYRSRPLGDRPQRDMRRASADHGLHGDSGVSECAVASWRNCHDRRDPAHHITDIHHDGIESGTTVN